MRIEPAAQTVAGHLGIALKLGAHLDEGDRTRIAEAMASSVMELVERAPRTALTNELLLTPDLASTEPVNALVFSGGVSEYVYETETRSFDDLAMPLAAALTPES